MKRLDLRIVNIKLMEDSEMLRYYLKSQASKKMHGGVSNKDMLMEIFPFCRLTVRLEGQEMVAHQDLAGWHRPLHSSKKNGLSMCLIEIASLLVKASSKGLFSTFAGSFCNV